jgi:hypothetical protein
VNSFELFVGKLLGGVRISSSELMALAPLLAVPFLSGGVSFELFLETVACLPTLFVLVLALGSLASALVVAPARKVLWTHLGQTEKSCDAAKQYHGIISALAVSSRLVDP